jgi:hypothetical protein
MKAMIFWLRDLQARQQPIPLIGFTPADLMTSRQMFQATDGVEDVTSIPMPKTFVPKNWVSWWLTVENYLKGQRGSNGKPLFYIVRERNPPANLLTLDQLTREAYQIPLVGVHYNHDNGTVFRLLHQLTLGTEGEAWVSGSFPTQDGRRAALSLKDHYDGVGERNTRYAQAEKDKDAAQYRGNEAVYSFSKYASLIKQSYTIMEQNSDAPVAQRHQVKHLIERMLIPTNHPYYVQYTNMKMSAVRDHGDNLDACITFLQQEISNFITVSQGTLTGQRRQHGVSAADTAPRGRGRFSRG